MPVRQSLIGICALTHQYHWAAISSTHLRQGGLSCSMELGQPADMPYRHQLSYAHYDLDTMLYAYQVGYCLIVLSPFRQARCEAASSRRVCSSRAGHDGKDTLGHLKLCKHLPLWHCRFGISALHEGECTLLPQSASEVVRHSSSGKQTSRYCCPSRLIDY